MPVQVVQEPPKHPLVKVEYFESKDAFIDDVALELRRKDRVPLVLFDVDLLNIEQQYALVRVLTGCPTDRTVYIVSPWPDSLCDLLAKRNSLLL